MLRSESREICVIKNTHSLSRLGAPMQTWIKQDIFTSELMTYILSMNLPIGVILDPHPRAWYKSSLKDGCRAW